MNYLITSKKLFLTGLIMILALSLLTVSCKKSQPTTPTNPNSGEAVATGVTSNDSGSSSTDSANQE